MLTQQNILSFLKENKEKFEKEFGVSHIGLFGSFASGKANNRSDVDILVSFNDVNNLHEKKTVLQHYLMQSFNREVDLCTEKYIKPYFKKQILKQVIYV